MINFNLDEQYKIWKRSVGGNVTESGNDGSENQGALSCISGYKQDGENCIGKACLYELYKHVAIFNIISIILSL